MSTGTNEIYRVNFQGDTLGEEELFWQYPNVSYEKDDVHLNGLTFDGDKFIASCFGLKDENGSWTNNGRIFYLDSHENIHTGLSHPHTPLIHHDTLYFAESLTSKVYIYNRQKAYGWEFDKVISLQGYPRGMAIHNNHLYVALSTSRKLSRSKIEDLNNETTLEMSMLLKVDCQTGETLQGKNIFHFGPEIYDIIFLPETKSLELVNEYTAITARLKDMCQTMDVIFKSKYFTELKLNSIIENQQVTLNAQQAIINSLLKNRCKRYLKKIFTYIRPITKNGTPT